MRYLFAFLCVCALGVVPLVGCSETAGNGGTGGTGGAILCEGDFADLVEHGVQLRAYEAPSFEVVEMGVLQMERVFRVVRQL